MNISTLSLGLTLLNGGDEITLSFTIDDGLAKVWPNSPRIGEPAFEWLVNMGWYQEGWTYYNSDGTNRDLFSQYDKFAPWCYE